MKIYRQLGALILAAPLLFSLSPLRADDVAEGHEYFLRYCASCHGVDGTGDGPVAKALTTPPANLRMLADKYGMPLPSRRLAELIDGRDTVKAHGATAMPVWGERLYETPQGKHGEVDVRHSIELIVKYLATIQDRRTALNLLPGPRGQTR